MTLNPQDISRLQEEEYYELDALHTKALREQQPTFEFKGDVWMVEFASYVLEYLQWKLGIDKKQNDEAL
jgi:hypothetical protein